MPYYPVNTPLPEAWRGIPKQHPRLFGSLERLKQLALARPEAYRRTQIIAREKGVDDTSEPVMESRLVHRENKLISMALVAAIDGDAALARRTVDVCLDWHVDRTPHLGHTGWAGDMVSCSLVFDLCHEAWTPSERLRLFRYFGACRDANINEEPCPFHNGWYAMRHNGYGAAGLATMHEWERAPAFLAEVDHALKTLGHPALDFAGNGGCFTEGFYTQYWIESWVMFLAMVHHASGLDLFAACPSFYKNRAVASMFECYPGLQERGSRRGVAFGDAGGRYFGHQRERDRNRTARNILINHFRDDADHQSVASFQDTSPGCGADESAWKDFMFADATVPRRDHKKFKLSHFGRGAGMVHARSSWEEDATYFAFKCAGRFSGHEHLDNGHFYIVKHKELATRSGQYYEFGGEHDVNFHCRSIAHNTMLIHDPSEVFPFFLKGYPGWPANDGGQAWPWVGTPFRHNGWAESKEMWLEHRELGDTGRMTAYHDAGPWLYTGGDLTRAYSAKKLKVFTRQIVFIRPGTFVVFDRVESTDPSFKKTWLLHAAKPPSVANGRLTIAHGLGRLTVDPLLPANPLVTVNTGEDQYTYGGRRFIPARSVGPCAECRIDISPRTPATFDYFLNVLTADDANTPAPAAATVVEHSDRVEVSVAGAVITFTRAAFGGSIKIGGKETSLPALS